MDNSTSAAREQDDKIEMLSPAFRDNKYLNDLRLGLGLFADLVKDKSSLDEADKLLLQIKTMIFDEFNNLLDNDVSPRSSIAYRRLQLLFDDLVEISSFPSLENKNIVAVGGQFSSGKSNFLNTILNSKKLLPTDTDATTSIPTYIIAGKDDTIQALNKFQNLADIDKDALFAISHMFKDIYDVSFSHILKLITIQRKNIPYKNIVFLDTPGYSKDDVSSGFHDNSDKNIAREHLRNADALIWLIDIISGTIPEDDIKFLLSLKLEEKPVLVVFNKADKLQKDKIMEIISVARNTLIKQNINVHDVIGFSARENKEYSTKLNVLSNFLKSIDNAKAGTAIIENLEDIFKDFLNYHYSEKEFSRATRKITSEELFSSLNDKSKAVMQLLNQRLKKKIDKLKSSEELIQNFQETLNNTISKLLLLKNISVQSGELLNVTRPPLKSESQTTYRFPIFLNDHTKMNDFSDYNTIKGVIKKISPNGITLDLSGVTTGFIDSQKIKKVMPEDWKSMFSEGIPCTVQYTGKSTESIATIQIEN